MPRPLDAHTERNLFRRWSDCRDLRARDRIVTSQQAMVQRWARRYASGGCSRGDLAQEGNVGLLRALERFELERGVRFATFAVWWVRAHMLRFVERNSRLIRGGTTAARRRLFYQLGRAQAALGRDGSAPSVDELAEVLEVPAADVRAMAALRMPAVSLDTPLHTLQDACPSPEEGLARHELAEQLDRALGDYAAGLDGPALEMFWERVASSAPLPLRELSRRWGVSQASVRRLEKRVATPLRRHLYQAMGDTIVHTLGTC